MCDLPVDPTTRPYRWIFLDADGTLYDFEAAETVALAAAFSAITGRYDPVTYLPAHRAVNTAIWAELERGAITSARLPYERFHRLFRVLGLVLPVSTVEDTAERYITELARCAQLLPGALEAIRALASGHALVLLTNGLSRVQRPRIAASPLAPYFRAIVVSDELGVAKPDPRIFEAACAAAGAGVTVEEKRDMLMVGDSLGSDIAGGRAFGIDTCWFDPTRKTASTPPDPRPTYVIHDLAMLAPIARTRKAGAP